MLNNGPGHNRDASNIKSCPFCSELSGGRSQYSDWAAENSSLPANRILYAGSHWVIVPSIGAITSGYLLFISKLHRLSAAECGAQEIAELEDLIDRTRDFLEKVYHLPCVLFEHGGTTNAKSTAASVSHCHIHIVPFRGDLLAADDDRAAVSISGLRDIGRQIQTPASYLFYQSNQKKNYLIVRGGYPSQYFRKLLAERLGIKERWDWRDSPLLPNFMGTYGLLKRMGFEKSFLNE